MCLAHRKCSVSVVLRYSRSMFACLNRGLPWWLRWESACSVGDLGLILGSGRSPGGGNSNLL